MRLEKDKADMSCALQRASTDKDQEVVAARAAASIAEGKLQSLLEELSNAKHTSEAASTTSGFVLKVCGCISRPVVPWLVVPPAAPMGCSAGYRQHEGRSLHVLAFSHQVCTRACPAAPNQSCTPRTLAVTFCIQTGVGMCSGHA